MGLPQASITVVMQGDLRPQTPAAIRAVRQALPGCGLVLSTFQGAGVEALRRMVDEIVLSDDPGAMPPTTVGAAGGANNINRQIVSSQAGLRCVRTSFAVKLRTDCIIENGGFIALHTAGSACPGGDRRIVVSTYYTRHPAGICRYQFHVSDWFAFGRTPRLQALWDAPALSAQEATWFERHAHRRGSTPIARRFRARFTQEQHVAVALGRKLGYRTPEDLNHAPAQVVADYERFLATEFIVAEPRLLGLRMPKYEHLDDSLYQRLDNVSFADWLALAKKHGPAASASWRALDAIATHSTRHTAIARTAAHALRHPISKALLYERQQILRHQDTPGLFSRQEKRIPRC